MNVASLKPSQELHELSGWDDTYFFHDFYEKDGEVKKYQLSDKYTYQWVNRCPAYDSGFLLRKLPAVIGHSRFLNVSHVDAANDGGGWVAGYTTNVDDIIKFKVDFSYSVVADTPEDAACKLAIELFKQGVLE